MLKTICGKTYDTDSAKMIKRKAVGVFGDPAGYEETLYQTESGLQTYVFMIEHIYREFRHV